MFAREHLALPENTALSRLRATTHFQKMSASADAKACDASINSGRAGKHKDGPSCAKRRNSINAGRGGKHKDGLSGAKRRNSGGTLCRDGAEIVWSNKCRRRVLGMRGQHAATHDREVRILIELSKPQTGSNSKHQSILLAVQDQTSNQQARDVGVAQIVLLCEKFDVSTRTFALSIAIYDMFLAASGAQHSIENAAACYILACKYVEIFAPRLIDVCSVMSQRYTTEDLRNAENNVLDILRFDIGIVTGDKPNPSVAPHLRCIRARALSLLLMIIPSHASSTNR